MPFLKPSDAGRRVVIRRRLVTGEATATDVLGVLLEWRDGRLKVERSGGDVVEIDEADVLAAKVIPTRTVTRREVRELESAAMGGWPALETESLGGWVLRAAQGFTRRANSCLPLADPGLPFAAAIDRVERWYRDRDLSPAFQLPSLLGDVVERELQSRGWVERSEDVLILTAPADDVAAARREDLPEVLVTTEPDAAWLGAYHYRDEPLPPVARQVLTGGDVVGFANVNRDGRLVAIARGTVNGTPGGKRWLGVAAVEVDPAARRQGLGKQVVAGLAAWSLNHGASGIYLQVSEDNTTARRAYSGLGFAEHHRYHYLHAPRK